MVVTTDSIASQAGVDVLRAGGNAVDAAVAVMFALAVVNPEAGNLGGGGFMVARMADGTTAALDFREKAPLAATRDMYLDERGDVTDRSLVGHLAVGVPGSPMGMWEAHRRFGTRTWAELLEPAIALAEGFPVRPRFLESLDAEMIGDLTRFPASAASFLVDGHAPEVGTTLRQPDLAETLRRISDQGADGFYRGRTADLLVAEMQNGGGLITHDDLEQYAAAWRDPIRFQYRGYSVLSMPPSSSGGTTLAESANILETFPLPSLPWHSAREIHLLAEAWKRAFADRNTYLTDPDFAPMPIDALTSDDYAKELAGSIGERATPSFEVRSGAEGAPPEGMQTTHFSIVDGSGNAVAITTTLNSWYGSKVTVTGAGFVLNNEMDDFTSKPGTPNQFGLVQGEKNTIEPGKRMLSAMTPTVVLDPQGQLFMVLGTPGGPTIITSVLQTLSNVIDHGMALGSAVVAPRVHHQHLPDRIDYEPGGLPPDVITELRALGHEVGDGGFSGDVQAIRVRPDGTMEGFSDPRMGGRAIGY
ncbi:MAG: gamma-glutamyltransferase [Gemmatimonadetes bacterium]|nr:gamma-glutamyltransferase [Gemmatimonadota bacterium]